MSDPAPSDPAPSADAPAEPRLWRFPRNVWVLGLASLLNDAASEMVMPLLPVFLATSLGGGAAAVGLVEGTADLVASALKWGFGVAADRAGRARPFVVAGYALAAVSRPFLALATAPVHVLAVRVTDRIGKGVRTAPRDALLGASVPPEERGAAFGFHKSMDHLGAAIGPALALLVLMLWTRDLRTVFVVAAVPGILAALVVPLARELPRPTAGPAETGVPPGLVAFLVPVALASVGTASDAFLMLRAGLTDHAPLEALPALWVALHLVRTSLAGAGGWLADRADPRWVVAAGWSWRAVVFAWLAAATDPWLGAVGVVAYGLASASEPAEKKLVAGAVGAAKSGTAFGLYHGVVGACALPGGLLFGWLWDTRGAPVAWGCAAGLVLTAVVALPFAAPAARPAPPRA